MSIIAIFWNRTNNTIRKSENGIVSAPTPCTSFQAFEAYLNSLSGYSFSAAQVKTEQQVLMIGVSNSGGGGTGGLATEQKQDAQIALANSIASALSSLLSDTSNIATNTNDTKNAVLATVRTRQTAVNADGLDAIYTEKVDAAGDVVFAEYRALDGSSLPSNNKVLTNATANISQNLTLVFESASGNSLVSKFERATSEVGELNGAYNTLWVTMQAKDFELADVKLYGRDVLDSRVVLPFRIERFSDENSTQIVSLKANISGIFLVTLEMVTNSNTGAGYSAIVFNASTVSTDVSPNQIGTQMYPVWGFRDLYDNYDFYGTIPFTTERILLSILSWLGYSGGETIGALLDRIGTQLPNQIGTRPSAESLSVTLATGGNTQFRTLSTASTNLKVVRNTASTLYYLYVCSSPNLTSNTSFVKLFNKGSAPTLASDVPVMTIPISSGERLIVLDSAIGAAFPLGIAMAITGAFAPADTSAGSANIEVVLHYA